MYSLEDRILSLRLRVNHLSDDNQPTTDAARQMKNVQGELDDYLEGIYAHDIPLAVVYRSELLRRTPSAPASYPQLPPVQPTIGSMNTFMIRARMISDLVTRLPDHPDISLFH
jgi:hypothetical protein